MGKPKDDVVMISRGAQAPFVVPQNKDISKALSDHPCRSRQSMRILLAVLTCLSGGIATSCRANETPVISPDASAKASRAVSGELLVKLDQEAADALDRAIAAGGALSTGLDSLDHLFSEYGVAAAEKVFKGPSAESVDARYPERAKRAPKHAPAVDLTRTYKLTIKADADVSAAAESFKKDPHVESASPNYVVTTQQPEITR